MKLILIACIKLNCHHQGVVNEKLDDQCTALSLQLNLALGVINTFLYYNNFSVTPRLVDLTEVVGHAVSCSRLD